MTTAAIKEQIPKRMIEAHAYGIVGDAALEAEISHRILMVIQTRQRDDHSAVIDFDICELRLEVFRAITGRDAS